MNEHDTAHANSALPQTERRGPVTMGLLWLTMVTCFPSVLIGFEWCKQGFSLWQVIACTVLSCLMVIIYTVPIAHLSAVTGKGYGLLNRQLFGTRAASMINLMLVFIFVSFYGLAAVLLAEALVELFHWHIAVPLLAAVLATMMAMNNFFGFKGVANFARFVAAPLLIIWIFYTFAKAVPTCSAAALAKPTLQPFWLSLSTISSFVIGFALWGNEADYWRYGKPRFGYCLAPLAVALLVGEIIFPVTGWLVANLTGITDFGAATAYMTNYSFGGLPLVAAAVLSASYFAANDSNMFGSAGALQVMYGLKHREAVTILTVLGTLTAFALSLFGSTKALEEIVSINAVVLPVPTVLVVAEWIVGRRFGHKPFENLLSGRSAVWALASGLTVGIATSGVIPVLHALHVGVPFMQAWATAICVFVPLRTLEYRSRCVLAVTPSASPTDNRQLIRVE